MRKAPFPGLGGKRRVASVVWTALGDVQSYVEPFAGSLAVLLARPHPARTETVNDADCAIANFWRALQAAPDEVARYADHPVNEADLFARHLWLVTEGLPSLAGRLEADPAAFDALIAGWWVWGICSWIGSGWCAGDGPWMLADGKVVLGDAGLGVNRKLPHLGTAGQGVNRQLGGYLEVLAERIARVRVCCGDWSRVVTDGALNYGGRVGVLLDPPYGEDAGRTPALYRSDCLDVAGEARRWALEHGDDPRLRIVLCGYADEHDAEVPASWRRHRWSSSGAYLGRSEEGSGNRERRHQECLWFSPHCLEPRQGSLFVEGR